MPQLRISNNGIFNNVLLENEFKYDQDDMRCLFEESFSKLNTDQLAAFNEIIYWCY
jgi:hypothetical protein